MKNSKGFLCGIGVSEEGQALDAEYDEVSTCTSNALYLVTNSGGD